MTAPNRHRPALWVVVPAYNEARAIGGTLAALAAQSDRDFTLAVVDNGSTDATAAVVRAFAADAPFPVRLVHEPQHGTGAAVDSGFRHAIGRGAGWLARTDADCLPARDWVATVKSELGRGAEMVCGRSVPRPDESPGFAEARLLPAVIRLTALYGRYRKAHRHPRYRAPYVLCHGHNLALTADLYVRCGGTPRVTLSEDSEDVALLNRARRHSDRIVRAEHLVVHNSLRRLRAWGPRRTLLWYWDRRYHPATEAEVHVR
ncbi:glycosyltransferase family A protein [Streptomyces sp. NPDC018031]|uniref:glycosyltransferase family A protein n=1 Tax=Streptomyces sp. NPDC018031 TaxID=3365033 RepID=UPI0037AEEC40